MNFILWVLLYVSNTAFVWWVVWGGGASWFEGWRSLFIIDWLWSYSWNSEQIALYILVCWFGHTVWFAIGLFVPEARGFFW
jgi:hypothetical protein